MTGKKQHYITADDILARTSDFGCEPEVCAEESGAWKPYPELDTYHDAFSVSDAAARNFMPAAFTDAPGTSQAELSWRSAFS